MELVHDDLADVGSGALAQRDIGQYLGRAANDRRLAVDRGIAGQHPYVDGAEDIAQGEELLGHQGLDRGRVERPLALGKRREVRTSATRVLPEPVGVDRMTFEPVMISMTASSCAG